ncbi:hypothetical protein SUGI_0918980 [Cryptomeria japonica]|nr:hypothetical protein SUGI_0918980 [Cryptomeria japonica]
MTEIEAINAVASTQGFSKGMIIGEDESHKMEKETFLHGMSSDNRVTQQSSNVGNLGKENLLFDANKEEIRKGEIGHTNGELQDEQQENSKVIAGKLYESKLKWENNLIDDKQKRMPYYQRLTHSRSLKTGNSLLAKSGNMSWLHLDRNKLAVKQLRSIIGVLATSNVTSPVAGKKQAFKIN